MTRGYCVIEKGGKVVSAAELRNSAYLEWYGKMILQNFREGKFADFISTLQSADWEAPEGIQPAWYRKVSGSTGNRYIDYAYVLREDRLQVYYYGTLLFSSSREECSSWLKAIDALDKLEDFYLYDADKLEIPRSIQAQKRFYKFLRANIRRIDELITGAENRKDPVIILKDDHCVDVHYRIDAPAYLKHLFIDGKLSATFVVYQRTHKWSIIIALPYIRKPILGVYASEGAAVNAIRRFVKATDVKLLISYADICNAYRMAETEEELQSKIQGHEEWLGMKDWFPANEIMKYFKMRNTNE